MGARARPFGCLCPGSRRVRAAELATLRQSSPLNRIFGTGAQPCPQAPSTWRHEMALLYRFCLSFPA